MVPQNLTTAPPSGPASAAARTWPLPTGERSYTIMYRNHYVGGDGWTFYPLSVTVPDRCPTCGELRGEPFEIRHVDDGEYYTLHNWHNACGHVDYYKDVYHEAQAWEIHKYACADVGVSPFTGGSITEGERTQVYQEHLGGPKHLLDVWFTQCVATGREWLTHAQQEFVAAQVRAIQEARYKPGQAYQHPLPFGYLLTERLDALCQAFAPGAVCKSAGHWDDSSGRYRLGIAFGPEGEAHETYWAPVAGTTTEALAFMAAELEKWPRPAAFKERLQAICDELLPGSYPVNAQCWTLGSAPDEPVRWVESPADDAPMIVYSVDGARMPDEPAPLFLVGFGAPDQIATSFEAGLRAEADRRRAAAGNESAG